MVRNFNFIQLLTKHASGIVDKWHIIKTQVVDLQFKNKRLLVRYKKKNYFMIIISIILDELIQFVRKINLKIFWSDVGYVTRKMNCKYVLSLSTNSASIIRIWVIIVRFSSYNCQCNNGLSTIRYNTISMGVHLRMFVYDITIRQVICFLD
jgi:hypothetical protein